MKTINDVLEALLINSNTDFTENDPNVEFKAIYDALQRINYNVQFAKETQEQVVNWIKGFNTPFTFTDEDKEELLSEVENINLEII